MYFIAPTPAYDKDTRWMTWENGFKEEELNQILSYRTMYPKAQGLIDSVMNNHDKTVERPAETTYLPVDNRTAWLYDRLAWIGRQLNGKFWKFDINCFQEDVKIITYYPDTTESYEWHTDMAGGMDTPRKLGLILQLSDPGNYEGGDLELMDGKFRATATKQRGLAYIYPPWIPHRVTPITKGIRHVLLARYGGPAFR